MKFEREGIEIEVTGGGVFDVGELGRSYETLREAKEAIDKHLAEKRKMAKVKLDLPVITDHGEETAIVAMHATHFKFKLSPAPKKEGRFGEYELYAMTETSRELVREILTLKAEVEVRQGKLNKYRITPHSTYQQKGVPTDYEGKVKFLIAEHEKAVQLR
jgi:hypothetical protein